MSLSWPRSRVLPGQLLYPLPEAPADGILERSVAALRGRILDSTGPFRTRRLWREAALVRQAAMAAADLTAEERRNRTARLKAGIRRHGFGGRAGLDLLALVAAAGEPCWEESVRDGELAAALALLRGQVVDCGGQIDEIAAVTMAAGVAGHMETGVHVICTDAGRLELVAGRLTSLCGAIGLSMGVLEGRQAVGERRQAYRSDITCGMPGEFVNDTLRDTRLLPDHPGDLRLRLEQLRAPEPRTVRLLQRGLVFGIALDAVDMMLDRALRTAALSDVPGAGEELKALGLAYDIAGHLVEGVDYAPDRQGAPGLTAVGREKLRDMLAQRGGSWADGQWRDLLVGLALLARTYLEPGLHYHPGPAGVELVESSITPLVAGPYGRRLTAALLTIRHGLPMHLGGAPVVTMSQMEFLLRYRSLAGIDRAIEPGSRRELWTLYRLVTTSLRRSGRRREPGTEYHVGRDRGAALAKIADALQGVRLAHGQAWLLVESEPAAALIKQALGDRGLTVAATGDEETAGHTRAPDAVITVLQDGPGVPSTARLARDPSDVVLFQLPSAPGRAVIYRRWLRRCPGRPRRHLVIALDDPRLQRILPRFLARAAFWFGDRLPWLGRILAKAAIASALGGDSLKGRAARSEHRKIAGRVQKLLAFSGKVIR